MCSPSEWVERCCDIRVVNWLHHEGAHQAAGCWTLGLGKGQPAVQNIRKCFLNTETVQKKIKNGSTQFCQHSSYHDRNFLSCTQQGSSIRAGYVFFPRAYVFLYTCKCTQKICLQAAYEQKQKCDLWSHFFVCFFPLLKRLRNSYLVELPQDLGSDKPTNGKRAPISHTKVSKSEKPHWKLFIQLVPSSACSHYWVSCWSVPSATQELFCAY